MAFRFLPLALITLLPLCANASLEDFRLMEDDDTEELGERLGIPAIALLFHKHYNRVQGAPFILFELRRSNDPEYRALFSSLAALNDDPENIVEFKAGFVEVLNQKMQERGFPPILLESVEYLDKSNILRFEARSAKTGSAAMLLDTLVYWPEDRSLICLVLGRMSIGNMRLSRQRRYAASLSKAIGETIPMCDALFRTVPEGDN